MKSILLVSLIMLLSSCATQTPACYKHEEECHIIYTKELDKWVPHNICHCPMQHGKNQ